MFANTDWYLYNFRASLAAEARVRGMNVVLVSPDGPFAGRLKELGFRWIAAPMGRRSLNPVSEFRLLLWLVRLLWRERIDLVHGFTIKCAIYAALAARIAGVRGRIAAVTGMGYVYTGDRPLARLLRPLLKILFRFALAGNGARLIVQNADDAALVARLGLTSPDKVRLIAGSGVDCERFASRPMSGSCDPIRVLFPARLLWDKGVGEFVEAARIVKAAGQKVDFLIAGEFDPGNPASVEKSLVLDWHTMGLIEWLGHVEDMPNLFNSVEVVVLPSYREGLPKGLIEAAACGKCIVTTDVPGCRDVVTDQRDGLLVPAGNAAALADAIGRACTDNELRDRLGRAARAKALTHFDEKIVITQTLGVYRELAG